MAQTFGVNLRGVIDLLSQHLYSSPRVYVRELLQNAVDAVTARGLTDPGAPARIVLECPEHTGDGTLRIHDSGIGLAEDEVHTLLSTLGGTSKRDELGFARRDFLGQFGVGLLSCFLIADEVRLVSRSATGGPAVRWVGRGDGTYTVEVDDSARAEVGTTVTLLPRRDCDHWAEYETVAPLAAEFGSVLPYDVRVVGATGSRVITAPAPPWVRAPGEDVDDHRERLFAYCRETFGFEPFDALPLEFGAVGLTGAAFVLPAGAHPSAKQSHRVYLKRMLVGTAIEGLLPDWAYFVRCVVDTSALRPTASREALYEDETLLAVRDALGERLRDWLVRMAATDPERAGQLLAAHHMGIKSLALVDDELLGLAERWLPYETTRGAMPLRQFRRAHPTVLYTPDVDEFRQLAPVAAAQGIGLVNAGYAYDTDLLRRLAERDGPDTARRVEPRELLAALGRPDARTEAALAAAVEVATTVLADHDCEPTLREFDPVSLPALLVADADGARRRDAAAAAADADPLWSELLGRLVDDGSGAAQRLVLNTRNPLVARLGEVADAALLESAVRALYVHALLQSHRPLRPKDTAALTGSFLDLLDRAIGR
ncbi:HSP90 family protein [Actinokineospora sp. NBRC 105648]|uniref:HSP90 family protein n=1 Tax=Actinokineospora sp. NBRC 105648 TaxID=3032206 RepID=UPI0024A5BC1F|nr:HSP90 family protein [Actinokineospora sp. NBRC 105648]GLZ36899.1 molecular chaperone HtpG [Actinokineospora sp. NBRC 105648]